MGTSAHPKKRDEDRGCGTSDIGSGEKPLKRQALSTPQVEIVKPQHQCSLDTPGQSDRYRGQAYSVSASTRSQSSTQAVAKNLAPQDHRNQRGANALANCQGMSEGGNNPDDNDNSRQESNNDTPHPTGRQQSKRIKRSVRPASSCSSANAGVCMGDLETNDGSDLDNGQESDADACHPARPHPRP